MSEKNISFVSNTSTSLQATPAAEAHIADRQLLIERHKLAVCYITAGPRQHSDSWLQVPQDSCPYYTVRWFWEPADP
jgi:hypothetical protein